MTGKQIFFGALFCGAFAAGFAPLDAQDQERGATPESVTIEVDEKYGTLAFRGTVERIDLEEEIEFYAHIAVTFHPDEKTNKTPVADLRGFALVATVPPSEPGQPGQPWKVLYRENHEISVRLSKDGETKRLPDLTFRVPRSVSARAAIAGLQVHDGQMMWPISENLNST